MPAIPIDRNRMAAPKSCGLFTLQHSCPRSVAGRSDLKRERRANVSSPKIERNMPKLPVEGLNLPLPDGRVVCRVLTTQPRLLKPSASASRLSDDHLHFRLGRQIRHHRIEHRETGRRDAQTSVAVALDEAVRRQRRDATRIERPAGERRIARRIDAFGEAQPHQQEFVGALFAREHLVGDEAVAELLDAHQPGLGPLFGRGGVAAAVDVEPAMRARADAGVFVLAPVDEIVPALGARPRVIGNLVGRQAGAAADLLRQVVERAAGVVVGNDELAGLVQRVERRVRLDGELIERQMLGGFADGALELGRPLLRRLPRPRVDQIERIALE